MNTRMFAVVLVLVSSVLAGCADSGGDDKDVTSEPQFNEDTGALTGLVVSDENTQLMGVTVSLRELQLQTETDSFGRFTFNNVAPGDYSLDAFKLGFEALARRVTVIAGDTVEVDLVLKPLAVDEPYHLTQIGDGYIACSVRFYPGVPDGGLIIDGWITGAALCTIVPVPVFPDDKFLLTYPAAAGVKEVLLEMEWESTQALGKALSVVMEHDDHANEDEYTFGEARGTSPLVIYAHEAKMAELTGTSGIDCNDIECTIMTRVFAEANTTELYTPPIPIPEPIGQPPNKVDVGFVYDQSFTQYLTTFHLQGRPAGFSALADA